MSSTALVSNFAAGRQQLLRLGASLSAPRRWMHSVLPNVIHDVGVSTSEDLPSSQPRLDEVIAAVEQDCQELLQVVSQRSDGRIGSRRGRVYDLAVMLTSAEDMRELNERFRGVPSPTDVLSFGVPDEQAAVFAQLPKNVPLPLGEMAIAVPVAEEAAKERGHTLRDEMRILLVHGVLHLIGWDHEKSEEEARAMHTWLYSQAASEGVVLESLGWNVDGLIAAASGSAMPIDTVVMDMDGTALNSRSKMDQSTVEALRNVLAAGKKFVVATGKAQVAAQAAFTDAGASDLFEKMAAGVFLQGLSLFDGSGKAIASKYLEEEAVIESFEIAKMHDIAACAFSGSASGTLKAHELVDELADRYYEPRAKVFPNVRSLLQDLGDSGKAFPFLEMSAGVQKIILLAPQSLITSIRPDVDQCVQKYASSVTQAVEGMLEIVPMGTNKGTGIKAAAEAIGLDISRSMAIGDGENDLPLFQACGMSAAMANASQLVKAAATVETASNDEGGVADAIYSYMIPKRT